MLVTVQDLINMIIKFFIFFKDSFIINPVIIKMGSMAHKDELMYKI